MINHKLVLPEHLNHYGYLFGGYLLHWVDEYAYITANLDFPGHRFVTIGLDNVVFRKSIRLGSVLKFDINRTRMRKHLSRLQCQGLQRLHRVGRGGACLRHQHYLR